MSAERRIAELERKVSSLMSGETGTTISNYNIAGAAPTDAELDAAFGDAADLYNGFMGIVDDNGGTTAVYLCIVVNDAWFYELLTKAV